METGTIRQQVEEVCYAWADLSQRLQQTKDEIHSISSSIDDVTKRIRILISEKRSARRDEKQQYREWIADAKSEKADLIARIEEKRSQFRALVARRNELLNVESSLRRRLQSESTSLRRNYQKIGGNVPGWASEGLSALQQSLENGVRFCREQLARLNQSFGRGVSDTESHALGRGLTNSRNQVPELDDMGGTEDLVWVKEPPSLTSSRIQVPELDDVGGAEDLVWVEEPPFWSVLGPTPDVGKLLQLIEPPQAEPYITLDGTRTVPCEYYQVFDTLDVRNESTERIGVIYADAFLQSTGHSIVLEIGGSGKADLLSLDAQKQLWITEVKGTRTNRDLTSSGLKRTVKDTDIAGEAVYKTMHENSPEWLMRKSSSYDRVIQVLSGIDIAISSTNEPARKEELRVLRESYRSAARQGFSPLACEKQVIQVGMQEQGNYLKPLNATNSEQFDELIDTVDPSKIVQIDVVEGSMESPIYDAPSTELDAPSPDMGDSASDR